MIEIQSEHSVTFKLSNTVDFPSVDIFCKIMDKLDKEAKKRGFKNMFNSEEKFFIDNFVKEIKNEIKYNNG